MLSSGACAMTSSPRHYRCLSLFTEERKGDLSQDDHDIMKWNCPSLGAGCFHTRAANYHIYLTSLVIISPSLTAFLLILLPVAGLIIGRISKSLKSHRIFAQEQLSNMLGVITNHCRMRVKKHLCREDAACALMKINKSCSEP